MNEQTHMMAQGPHPGKLLRFAFVGLIALLLIGFGVSNIQQAAWSQGYATGLMAGSGDSDTLTQYLLYNRGLPQHAGPRLGGFFLLGLLFFGFLAVARASHIWMWRMAGGSEREAWQQHWRHGPQGKSRWGEQETAAPEPGADVRV